MESLPQGVCEFDEGLGKLLKVEIQRAPIFDNPIGLKFTWECQKCHSQFTTTIPYLEILFLK